MTTTGLEPWPIPRDTGRAVLPSERGFVERPDGVRIAFETFGSGEPTLVLLPSSPIVHSRQWKGQVPYLSRHYRVVTFDGRGNGQSDRPTDPDAYRDARVLGDIEAVMDTTGTDAAVVVGLCGDGVWRAIELAATRAERVLGIVAFAPGVPRPVAATSVGDGVFIRGRAIDRRRLGQEEPPLLATRLRRVRALLLRGDHVGTPLDEADR